MGCDTHSDTEEEKQGDAGPDTGNFGSDGEAGGEVIAEGCAQPDRHPQSGYQPNQVEDLADEPSQPAPYEQTGNEETKYEIEHRVVGSK